MRSCPSPREHSLTPETVPSTQRPPRRWASWPWGSCMRNRIPFCPGAPVQPVLHRPLSRGMKPCLLLGAVGKGQPAASLVCDLMAQRCSFSSQRATGVAPERDACLPGVRCLNGRPACEDDFFLPSCIHFVLSVFGVARSRAFKGSCRRPLVCVQMDVCGWVCVYACVCVCVFTCVCLGSLQKERRRTPSHIPRP